MNEWQVRQSAGAALRRGFSMIDLLVSLAVITMLVAVTLPSLARAQEAARQVVCATRVKQLGYALTVYTNEYGGELPPTVFATDFQGNGPAPQETIFIHPTPDENHVPRRAWDGLGLLFAERFVDHPGIFYCPSHRGEHDYDRYASFYRNPHEVIASNYQYRLPEKSSYLAELRSWTTLVSDAMRTQADFNHRDGSNVLRADMSVQWYRDTNGRLFASLAATSSGQASKQGVVRGWSILDANGSTPNQHNSGQSGGNDGGDDDPPDGLPSRFVGRN